MKSKYILHFLIILKLLTIFFYKRGDYMYSVHDHIAYRYEIIEMLGKGSFG